MEQIEVKKIIQCKDCKMSKIIDSNNTVNWLPLLLCWPPDKYLGISESGQWVVEEKSGLRRLNNSASLLRIKVLLEKSHEEARNIVNEVLKSNNINLDFDLIFPYKELIEEVLKNDSNYWVDLAFKWYDNMPYDIKISLIQTLDALKDRKSLSQKIRHKAIKELAFLYKQKTM